MFPEPSKDSIAENGDHQLMPEKCAVANAEILKCGICSAVFGFFSDLKIHMRSHTGERPFQCNQCDFAFTIRGNLNKHLRAVHKTEVKYIKVEEHTKAIVHKSRMPTYTGARRPYRSRFRDWSFGRHHTTPATPIFGQPFRCDVCDAAFRRHVTLLRHMNIHMVGDDGGEQPIMQLKCDTCGLVCRCISELQKHMFIHTGIRPYKCDTCDAAFTQNGNLKRHILTHVKEKCEQERDDVPIKATIPWRHAPVHVNKCRLKCDSCNATFRYPSQLKKHRYDAHGGSEASDMFKCDVCEVMLPYESDLRIHMRRHTGERPYRCDFCPAAFAQRGNMKRHALSHTRLRCKACGAKFYKITRLMSHVCTGSAEHHESENGEYDVGECLSVEMQCECQLCDAMFGNNTELQSHMQAHAGVKPFVCYVCDAAFGDRRRLQRHLGMHSSAGRRPYACYECDAKFISARQLISHMSVHTGERPFKCYLCGDTFGVARDVTWHMQMHADVRPFNCYVCDEEFCKLGDAKLHVQSHVREPLVCDSEFVGKIGDLSEQEHTTERNFICYLCDNIFVDGDSLNVHLDVHVCEQPFTCFECDLDFCYADDLKIHLRSHSREEQQLSCFLCDATFEEDNDLKAHLRSHE